MSEALFKEYENIIKSNQEESKQYSYFKHASIFNFIILGLLALSSYFSESTPYTDVFFVFVYQILLLVDINRVTVKFKSIRDNLILKNILIALMISSVIAVPLMLGLLLGFISEYMYFFFFMFLFISTSTLAFFNNIKIKSHFKKINDKKNKLNSKYKEKALLSEIIGNVKTIEDYEYGKAICIKNNFKITLNELNKKAIEILKEDGYSSLSDYKIKNHKNNIEETYKIEND